MPAFGVQAPITDDTQMTLFTVEALLAVRDEGAEPAGALWESYQRWLTTQDFRKTSNIAASWLFEQPVMHATRAPGNTCLSALAARTTLGPTIAPNNSKGCGGVMRAAPAGLIPGDPFELGCLVASLTHGHPSGYLAAGAFAVMIARLVEEAPLEDAVAAAVAEAIKHPQASEVVEALAAAEALVRNGRPSAEKIESLGGGWVAEEALAIGVAAALAAESFEEGVLLAVNHSGDSDSTGAICGNLLGAALGAEAIPARWRAEVEAADVIAEMARRLARA